MQYIIMSDGKGIRWNNYNGDSKQSIKIIDESLLERTVRLLRENNCNNILISSHDSRHEITDIPRIESDYPNMYHNQYAFDYLNKETTFLYGDTFYLDKCISTIVNSEVNDVMFYGNSKAIIAIKVIDYDLFKRQIDSFTDKTKTIYHAFDGVLYNKQEIPRFYRIDDLFININTPDDYLELIKILPYNKGHLKKLYKNNLGGNQ